MNKLTEIEQLKSQLFSAVQRFKLKQNDEQLNKHIFDLVSKINKLEIKYYGREITAACDFL